MQAPSLSRKATMKSQESSGHGCGFQPFSRSIRPFRTIAKGHGSRSRRAAEPGGSNASCDKAGPKLYGISVRPLRPAGQQRSEQSTLDSASRPPLGLNNTVEALRAHGRTLQHVAAGIALSAAVLTGPAVAADVAKVGSCLLGNCQVVLAKCLADGECLENLICLQLCNGRPDETACQIRCGDLYADKAVEAFTACAVSDKKCVPQRVDQSAYPEPPPCALDEKFDLNNFQGRWYITAGLNPLFDTFDCQEHFFGVPEPNKLYGKINWRIPKGNRDFIERSTVQTFDQKVNISPAYLRNDNNKYLNYTDDWYILASKPDEYVVIYYRGNNDAWKGYGGATVYTRAASLPEQYIPEISEAVKKAGLKWSDFKLTDNTCGPHPPQESLAQEIEEDLQKEVKQVEYALENDLKSFGKGFTIIEQGLVGEISKEEKILEQELKEAEDFVNRIERGYKLPGWLRWLYNLGFPMPDMPQMPNMTPPNTQAGNVSPAPGAPTAGSA